MSKYYHPINRLTAYFNFFSSGMLISIQDISEKSSIPLSIIREDFSLLLSQNALFEFDDQHEALYDFIENDLEAFIHLFKQGKYDNLPLCLNLPQLKYEQIFIDFSKDEIVTFNMFFNTELSDTNKITVKEDYNHNYIYTNLTNMLTIINHAILHQQTITLTYKLETGNLKTFHLFPLKIIHNKTTNLFVLLSIDKNNQITVNRFDGIKDISVAEEHFTIAPTDILDILPNVWDNRFNDKPYKVKIRFRNEANVFIKVKRDLACRTNGHLYEQDGFLYYEDVVYGLEAFKEYINSYGRSAIVLEPKLLRNMIINSLKERQVIYEQILAEQSSV